MSCIQKMRKIKKISRILKNIRILKHIFMQWIFYLFKFFFYITKIWKVDPFFFMLILSSNYDIWGFILDFCIQFKLKLFLWDL